MLLLYVRTIVMILYDQQEAQKMAVVAGKDNPAIGIDEEENGRVVKKAKQQF